MALEQLQTWQDYGTNTMYIKQTAIPLYAIKWQKGSITLLYTIVNMFLLLSYTGLTWAEDYITSLTWTEINNKWKQSSVKQK